MRYNMLISVDAGAPCRIMSRSLNLLLVTFGSILQPRSGLAIRSRAVFEALLDLGIAPSVISSEEPTRLMEESAVKSLRIYALKRPLRLGWSVELVQRIREISENVDAIIVSSAMLMPAVVYSQTRLPVIWDTNECETLHYRRLDGSLRNRLKGAIWQRLEELAGSRCRIAVAISDVEAKWWKQLFPQLEKKLMVVNHRPIINTDPSNVESHRCPRSPEETMLLFVGSMGGKHNAAAANWLLKVLAPTLPSQSVLVLAGKGTNELTLPCETGAEVRCLGEVEGIDALIAMADYCLAPLASGAGVKTKVLHYLAHGKRIIGTPLACEGLEDAPGLFSAELGEWCAYLPALMKQVENDPERRSRQKSQHEWLEARHGRRVVAEQWRAVLGRIM